MELRSKLDLGPSTTREDYAGHLSRVYEQTVPHGGNDAIRRHRDKVSRMTETEWRAHRAMLLDQGRRTARSGAARSMAAELIAKIVEERL